MLQRRPADYWSGFAKLLKLEGTKYNKIHVLCLTSLGMVLYVMLPAPRLCERYPMPAHTLWADLKTIYLAWNPQRDESNPLYHVHYVETK